MSWLLERGIDPPGPVKNAVNQRVKFASLSELFTVPVFSDANNYGIIQLDFSNKIKNPDFNEISLRIKSKESSIELGEIFDSENDNRLVRRRLKRR